MRRGVTAVAAASAALGAAFLSSLSAATPAPFLRSAAAHRGHVVAVFTLGSDLAADRIAVAVSPKTGPTGAFLKANVRLSESVRPTRVPSGYRFRTRHTLRAGRYYVQVSGIAVGVDCLPAKPCRESWSNVRRVIIPKRS